MITQTRLTDDIKSAGLDWITALRAPAIKALLEGGALQLSCRAHQLACRDARRRRDGAQLQILGAG